MVSCLWTLNITNELFYTQIIVSNWGNLNV
jgi:hypothetical protein